MPREAREVIIGALVAEIVEQEETDRTRWFRRSQTRDAALRPAPSMVGVDSTTRLTGRNDMTGSRISDLDCRSE
jgi:hypothetical protein